MSSTFLTTKFNFPVKGKAILQYFWWDEITKLDVVNHIPGDYYTMKREATKKPCGCKKNKGSIPNRHAQHWLICPQRDSVFTMQTNWLFHNMKNSQHHVPGDCAYLPSIFFTAHSVWQSLDFGHTTRLNLKFPECGWFVSEYSHIDDWFAAFQNKVFFPMIWLIHVYKFYT